MIELKFEQIYRNTYDQLKIGCGVRVFTNAEYKTGVLIDKHLLVVEGEGNYKQVLVDILLYDGTIIEKYKCYTWFQPNLDLL